MTESGRDAALAQVRTPRPQTKQRPSALPPQAAVGVPAPAPGAAKPAAQPVEVSPVKPGTVRITGVAQSSPVPGFPDCQTSGPEIWRPFFAKTTPKVRDVQRQVTYLSKQEQHEHVIALINAAIIEGQAQPWMYEVLAITMKFAKYPEDDIERVVLSVADFGNASYSSMIYSGAYLSNLGHPAAAIRMYRQAARMSPDQPEPYTLCMKLAAQTGVPDDGAWAACGVLRHAWGVDHVRQHQNAEDLLVETIKKLKAANETDQITKLNEQATAARSRDLEVRITWNGTGDLDLSVEDPAGGIASYQSQESAGGGILLGDGFGPKPANCHEEYVCPIGFTGEYVIRLKKAFHSGMIVGDRAVLTIVTHAGSPAEKKVTKSIQLDESNEYVQRITLEDGRREQRRAAFLAAPQGVARDWERVASQVGRRTRPVDREVRQAVAEMRISRQQGIQPAGGAAGGAFGAVGFAPVITRIPEGTRLAALAVVSADRRYVRLSLSPTFSHIVDVAVFTFQGR